MRRNILVASGIAVATAALVMTLGADVNISIPTNAAQDAKLARVLDYINQDRDVPFATIDDALEAKLIRDTRQLIQELDEREHRAILSAWREADEATKEQIRVLLGVQ